MIDKLNIQPKTDNAAKKKLIDSGMISLNETLNANDVNSLIEKTNELVDAYNFTSPVTAFNFKANVNTYEDLPKIRNEVNDGYGVLNDGLVYVWNGNAWPRKGMGINLGLKADGKIQLGDIRSISGDTLYKVAPNGFATVGADGVLSEEQRWKVAIDFNQENTPIWLNTPPPTKAGVFYPSEVGTYVNYGSIAISAADLNSNIVRIQFDGVNRFQKMVIGLNGQFLPLSGGVMNGSIVFDVYRNGNLLKANYSETLNNDILLYGYNAIDGYYLEMGVIGMPVETARKFKINERGVMSWDGAIDLKTPDGGTFLRFSNFKTGMLGYFQGEGGAGDDMMTFRKIDTGKYTLKMHDLIAENTIQTPKGDSDQWNSQTKRDISTFTNYIRPIVSKSEIWLDILSVYAAADTVSVELTILDTLYISEGVGKIEVSFVFQVFNARINRQFSRVKSILGTVHNEYYVDPNLEVRDGRVGIVIKRRAITANPITIRTEFTTSKNQSGYISQPEVSESLSELTDLSNVVNFPFSPQVPNPTSSQDAIPMIWADNRYSKNIHIIDINKDILKITKDLNSTDLRVTENLNYINDINTDKLPALAPKTEISRLDNSLISVNAIAQNAENLASKSVSDIEHINTSKLPLLAPKTEISRLDNSIVSVNTIAQNAQTLASKSVSDIENINTEKLPLLASKTEISRLDNSIVSVNTIAQNAQTLASKSVSDIEHINTDKLPLLAKSEDVVKLNYSGTQFVLGNLKVDNPVSNESVVNLITLRNEIAAIPKTEKEVLYEESYINPSELFVVDLTDKKVEWMPTVSFMYQNEKGNFCVGDLNLALSLNIFNYELDISNKPQLNLTNITKQLTEFKLYR